MVVSLKGTRKGTPTAFFPPRPRGTLAGRAPGAEALPAAGSGSLRQLAGHAALPGGARANSTSRERSEVWREVHGGNCKHYTTYLHIYIYIYIQITTYINMYIYIYTYTLSYTHSGMYHRVTHVYIYIYIY